MYTKIHKATQLYNMHAHKARHIVETIENYLPSIYISEVIKRCEDKGLTPPSEQVVRNVKTFRTKKIQVLEVILEFALENKKAQKKLEKMIDKK